MSCLNAFVVGPSEERREWKNIAETAMTLDKADFTKFGYPVDEGCFVRNPTKPSTASSSKRKGKSSRNVDLVRRSTKTLDLPIPVNDSDESDEENDDKDDVKIIAPLGAPSVGRSHDLPGSSASSSHPPITPSSVTQLKEKRKINLGEGSAFTKVVDTLVSSLAALHGQTSEQNKINVEMHAEARKNQHEFQMMMMKMMSSLQPPPLALLPSRQMAALQLLLSNRSSALVPETPPTQVDDSEMVEERHVAAPSPAAHFDVSSDKPIVAMDSIEIRDTYNISDDLQFDVEHDTVLEPERTHSLNDDSTAGCNP